METNPNTRPARAALKKYLIDLSIILALSMAGYWQLLNPGNLVYSRHSDLIGGGLEMSRVVTGIFGRLGDFPFWRSDMFSGYPAFSNPQMPFTNILRLPAFFFDFARTADWILWFHLFLAGTMFYLSGRIYGFRRITALFLGVSGLFSFKLIMAVYAGWPNVLSAVIVYPMLFALTYRLISRPELKTALALTATGLISLHAGHFQYAYYAALFLTLYVIWTAVIPNAENRRNNLAGPAAYLLIVILLIAGLSAFRYIPIAHDVLKFVRVKITYSFFLSGHSLGLEQLATFLNPEMLGTCLDDSYAKTELWEDAAYFGIVQLILAAAGSFMGMLQNRDKTRKNFAVCFTVFFALSLFLCFDSPVLRALYDFLPLFKLCRVPARFLFLTALFGTLMSGVGFEEITLYLQKRQSLSLLRLFAFSVLLTVSIEGAYYSRRYLKTIPVSLVEQTNDCVQFLKADKSLFRIAQLPLMFGNLSGGAGLQTATGYDSFNLRHYCMYFDIANRGKASPVLDQGMVNMFIRPRRPDLLDALNIKYIVSVFPLAHPNCHFTLVKQFQKQFFFQLFEGFQSPDLCLYVNKNARARAYWTSRIIPAPDEAQAASLLENNDISDAAVVIQGEALKGNARVANDAAAKVESFSDGHLALEAYNPAPGFLVVSEVWHPGWKAEIDGVPAKIYQTNLALMGVYAPQGIHKIRFDFLPCGFFAGVIISLISLAALFMIVLFRKNLDAYIRELCQAAFVKSK